VEGLHIPDTAALVRRVRPDSSCRTDCPPDSKATGVASYRAIAESGAAQSVDTLRCLIRQVSPSGTKVSR
jgi:hypothetical protein